MPRMSNFSHGLSVSCELLTLHLKTVPSNKEQRNMQVVAGDLKSFIKLEDYDDQDSNLLP
jgi:hypothetical protein